MNYNNLIPSKMGGVVAELEVYVTDEENFIPYESSNNIKSVSDEEEAKKKEKEAETNTIENVLSNIQAYKLHQGSIKETITYTGLYTSEWSGDYEGVNGEGRISIPYRKKDLKYIYKGVRCLLKVDRYSLDNVLNKPVTESFLCFITDVKINTNTLEISLSSFSKLLEETAKINFKQILRSQALTEVIKMAGLKPVVNLKGLKDEVIDYTNISSNSKNSNSESGEAKYGNDCTDTNTMACMRGAGYGNCGTGKNFDSCAKKGYAKKGSNYAKWAEQFDDVKSMLTAFRKRWHYSYYWNNHACPEKIFAQGSGNCYDTARLIKCLCDSRGFPCVVVTGSIWQGGHGFNCIKYNNSWYAWDACYFSHRGDKKGTNPLGW